MWARLRDLANVRQKRTDSPFADEAVQRQLSGIPVLNRLDPQPAPSGILPDLADLLNVQQALEAKIQCLSDENKRLRDLVSDIGAGLALERIRVDYVLSECEGLGGLRSLLSDARRSANFSPCSTKLARWILSWLRLPIDLIYWLIDA